MQKNLLVLRNKTTLEQTKKFFEENNIQAYYQEISKSEDVAVDIIADLKKSDIVLVTSQNALNAVLENKKHLSNKKIYCLNSYIADKISDLDVVPINWNNTKEIARFIIDNEQSASKIIHLCAENANKLFYQDLIKNNFNIKDISVYKTSFIADFNDEITKKLQNNKIQYIMIFSKESLNNFITIMQSLKLDINNYKIICFSQNIAKNISAYYAKNSNLTEMLNLYKNLETKHDK